MLLRYKVEKWTVDEETDEDLMVEVEHGTLVPDCCEAARTLLTVVCSYDYDDMCEDRFKDATPKWHLASPSPDFTSRVYSGNLHYYDLPTHDPKFCPYCGTPLPSVRRLPPDQVPQPMHDPDEDGDYCGSCDERSMNCTCHLPIEAWETVSPNMDFS